MTMSFFFRQIKKLLRNQTKRAAPGDAARRRVVPALELLEDRLVPASMPPAPPDFFLTPLDVREVYGFSALKNFTANGQSVPADGRGQTIAIIDSGDDPNIATDLRTFNGAFGLQQMDGQNGRPTFSKVNENGGNSLPGVDNESSEKEITLDVEWAHAIAPGANILLIELDPDAFHSSPGSQKYLGALGSALQTAAGSQASVVSMSFGTYNSSYPVFNAPSGVTYVSSSGDYLGNLEKSGAGPADLIVGGTEFTDTNGSLVSGLTVHDDLGVLANGEQVWDQSALNGPEQSSTPFVGTGYGAYFDAPIPSWQQGAAKLAANETGAASPSSTRMSPDVSLIATNLAVAQSFDEANNDDANTPWAWNGGTSASAPMWAGLIAIVNQGRALELPGRGPLNQVDPLVPMLYGLPKTDFNHVTSDPNAAYDYQTGLGTPIANLIVPALIAPDNSYSSRVEGNTLLIQTNQNGGNDKVSITAGTFQNQTYLEVTDNNAVDYFALNSFSTINIVARNATDDIGIYYTPPGVTTNIVLGSGTDTVNLSPNAETLSSLGGAVSIYGGSGIGRLNVYDNDDITANNNYWLTSNSFAGTAIPTVSFWGLRTANLYGGGNGGSSTITYHVGVNRDGTIAQPNGAANAFINLNLNGDGSSTENVDVVSTSAASLLTVNLGAGTETVTLSPKANLLVQLAGSVLVNGGGGSDTLNIDDQSNLIDSTYQITSQTVSRSYWNAHVQFSSIGTVNLNAGKGAGGDGTETFNVGNIMPGIGAGPSWDFNLYTNGTGTGNVNVENTPAAMQLGLNFTTPTNTIAITPKSETWYNIAGSVTIFAPKNSNTTLTVNDQKDTNAINYFIDSHSVAIDFGTPIYYSGVSNLNFYGGSGNQDGGDTYHIGSESTGSVALRNATNTNIYLSVYTTGTKPESVFVTDEYFMGFSALHYSLEGFGGISVSGHSADALFIENSAPQNLPTGFAAGPQTFVVTSASVEMDISSQTASGKLHTNSIGKETITYSDIGYIEVDGGQAGEHFNVGDNKTNLDLLLPTVSIQGLATDSLTINNSPAPNPFFSTEAPDFTIGSAKVTWRNPVTINSLGKSITLTGEIDYAGVSTLEVDGGPVSSTYNVQGTPATTSLTIKDGAGGDQVNVATGNLSAIGGSLTIHGKGQEYLFVNDAFDPAGTSYVLAADHIGWTPGNTASVPTRLTYDGIPSIELDGAAGGNFFTINGRAASTSTSVYAGAGSDTVQLTGTANSFAGVLSLNGQGGANTLDYSKYQGSVTVNLPRGTAQAVSGGITKFRNVTGGTGNDLFVGDGTGNVLTGGTGRNVLIAGAGPGKLIGNSGQDLLVGGTTNYDTNATALAAIMAEWTSNASYANRVQHLLQGGGLNGNTLLSSTTFTNNGGGNALTGSDGLDLFYGIKAFDANDWKAALNEVFIENPAHVSVQIDARALSTPYLTLDGLTLISTQTPATYSIAPGTHTLIDYYGGYYNAAAVTFKVRADGTISFDSSLANILATSGPGMLQVKGATVTIDAHFLYTARLTVDVAKVGQTASPFKITVLPGPQELFDTWATGSTIHFTVSADGKVGYDSSLGTLVSGQGTGTLTVTGTAITIDAHTLSTPLLTVDISNAKPTANPFTINVLPGPQSMWDYYGSGPTLNFNVTADGKITYDPSLAGIFSTQGSTLTVTGQNVTIDPRKLSLFALVIDTAIAKPMTSEFTLQLLPGDHWLTDNYGWSTPIHFTVGSDGNISYAGAPPGIFSGAGTPFLTLNGETLQIDAAAISGTAPYFTIATRGGLAADQLETLTVLPGTFQFTAGSEQFLFTLSGQDKLDYDSGLDSALTGEGTNLLTLDK